MARNRKYNGKRKRANARSGRQRLNVRAKSKRGTRARRAGAAARVAKVAAAVALVVLLVVGVRRAIDHLLFESPKFKLSVIDYETDGHLPRARVLDAAGVERGGNILRIDLDAARERILEGLPQVRGVEIVPDLPDRIAFRVEERHPVAWLGDPERPREPQKRRGGWLLDGDGVVVECERLEPRFVALPVVYAADYADAKAGRAIDSKAVRAAIELVGEIDGAFASSPVELDSLRVENRYSLIGYLNTGAEITFGLKEIGRQVDDLQVLLAEATRRGRALATANLLVKKNTPVRFASPGAGRPAPRAQPVARPAPASDADPGPPGGRPKVRRSVPRSATPRRGGGDPVVRSILGVD